MKRFLISLAAAGALVVPWALAASPTPAVHPSAPGAVLASCREDKGGIAPVAFFTDQQGATRLSRPVMILACGGGTCKPSPFPGGLPCRA